MYHFYWNDPIIGLRHNPNSKSIHIIRIPNFVLPIRHRNLYIIKYNLFSNKIYLKVLHLLNLNFLLTYLYYFIDVKDLIFDIISDSPT